MGDEAILAQAPPEAVDRLFGAIFDRYGFDFRGYAPGYLRRRVARSMADHRLGTVEELEARVLGEREAMGRLVDTLTIHTTSLFREPEFFQAVREHVVPWLRTYPFVRIWVAGCSTGEEAYSLAILLHEEGIYSRCRIYATDFNETVLARAKAGIYPLALMREYAAAHAAAGGRGDLSIHYADDGRNAVFDAEIRERIVFAQHNLAGDGPFNEFHAVFCRNVLIYFDRPLQGRVHDLMWGSLVPHGFLALGSSESLSLSVHQDRYEEMPGRKRIYRKTTPR